MKIVILVRILWTAGGPKIAIREAESLKRLGHEARLIFLRGSELSGYRDLLGNIPYEVLSKDGRALFTPIYDRTTRLFAPDRGPESRVDFNLIRSLPKHLDRRDVDLLICHDQFAGLAGYYAKRQLNIPYSVFLHEHALDYHVPILGRIAHSYVSRVLRNASAIYSVTQKVANSYVNVHGVKSCVNLPGFDLGDSTPFSEKQDYLIAVAMWDGWRKPELYLDIIEALPDFQLHMVGNWRNSDLRRQFLRAVDRRRLSSVVTLHEGVSELELIHLFQLSKFSLRFGFGEEGLGTSVVESIQNGIPVILNRDLGTAEVIDAFGCGLVVNQGGVNLNRLDVPTITKFIENYNNRQAYAELQRRVFSLGTSVTWQSHAQRLLPARPPRD